MASAKTVKLPKDRNGQTLHIGDEVLVFNGTELVAQGEVVFLTLIGQAPVHWHVDLYAGAVGDRLYRTLVGGFEPYELERIEVADDGTD